MAHKTKVLQKVITIQVTKELCYQFIAASYMLGHKGQFSVLCRQWLGEKLESFIGGLSPVRRAEYDEILQNVRLMDAAPDEVGEVISSMSTNKS